MGKKNVLYLSLILLFGVFFRLWHMTPLHTGNLSLGLHFGDFFEIMFQNTLAPLYPLINNLFNITYLDKVQPYLSIIFDIASIFGLYYLGAEFNDKKNEILTGLISAGFSAISVFLIHLAQANSKFSLVFMLSVFILLYSVKIINTQNKKYLIHLSIFDILLILTFNLGVFFVVFNILGVMSFYAKKRKNFEAYFTTFVGLLFLISPLIPFVLKFMDVPNSVAQYSLPFDFRHVIVYLTNMFSSKLSLIESLEFSNVGFWIFVILPSAIGLFLVLKGILHKRNSSYMALATFISTFLSMLIICLCGSHTLLSEYLVTLYPILIMSFANGIPSLKSKTLKIVLPTIFGTITIFYIIVHNIVSADLF